jgi:hypothetical protein
MSELGDAMMLCAEGPVHSLAALSLIPEHRRGHGALYDAVNHGRISITRLRRSLAGLPVPCQNSHTCAELVFSVLVTLPRVLADQAVNDLSALDPGGHVDRLARLVQRRPLLPRLMGRCSL